MVDNIYYLIWSYTALSLCRKLYLETKVMFIFFGICLGWLAGEFLKFQFLYVQTSVKTADGFQKSMCFYWYMKTGTEKVRSKECCEKKMQENHGVPYLIAKAEMWSIQSSLKDFWVIAFNFMPKLNDLPRWYGMINKNRKMGTVHVLL